MGVIESLLPVFLIIGLGAALAAGGFLTADFLQKLNRLAYWVGMPALLFASVCNAKSLDARPFKISLVLLGATIVSLVIAFVCARMMRLGAESSGTFVQASFRSNLVFVGLPLAVYAFSQPGASASPKEIASLLVVAAAPVMIIYNAVAVVVLATSGRRLDQITLRDVTRRILANPLVVSIAAGLIFARLGWTLPTFLSSTINSIGALAIPAALLGVGGISVSAPLREHIKTASLAAMLKVAITPLSAMLIGRLFGLSPLDTGLAVLLSATPTAAASFTMSLQFGGSAGLASSAIMLSTICSAASLAWALSLVR